jgi:hypothetical protein
MRTPLKRFRTGSAQSKPNDPDLSEVLRALASVTREEKMRGQLTALAQEEENSRIVSISNSTS